MRFVAPVAVVAFALAAVSAPAQAWADAADKKASLLLKVLAHDRNFAKRAGGKARIGVVYAGSGRSNAEVVAAALRKAGAQATVILFQSTGALVRAVDGGVNAIFIVRSARVALSSIQQVTRAKKLPSLSGTESLASRGVAVTAYIRGGAARLVINLRAARSDGMNIDSRVLRLARVIR